jgi:hypothetical protein
MSILLDSINYITNQPCYLNYVEYVDYFLVLIFKLISIFAIYFTTILFAFVILLFIISFIAIGCSLIVTLLLCLGMFSNDLDNDFMDDVRSSIKEKHFAKDKTE